MKTWSINLLLRLTIAALIVQFVFPSLALGNSATCKPVAATANTCPMMAMHQGMPSSQMTCPCCCKHRAEAAGHGPASVAMASHTAAGTDFNTCVCTAPDQLAVLTAPHRRWNLGAAGAKAPPASVRSLPPADPALLALADPPSIHYVRPPLIRSHGLRAPPAS